MIAETGNNRVQGWRPAATLLAVAVAYYVGAQLGFILRFPPTTPSVLWPPNSILTATLLLTPVRRWWLYLLAALPAHLAAELPVAPAPRVRPLCDELRRGGRRRRGAPMVERRADALRHAPSHGGFRARRSSRRAFRLIVSGRGPRHRHTGGILLIRLAHPLLLQRPRVAPDRAGSRHGRTQRAAESPRSGSAPPSRGGPARQRALPGEYGSGRESVGVRA